MESFSFIKDMLKRKKKIPLNITIKILRKSRFVKNYQTFQANILFMYLLKIPENQMFSVFRWYRKSTLA